MTTPSFYVYNKNNKEHRKGCNEEKNLFKNTQNLQMANRAQVTFNIFYTSLDTAK